MNDENRDLMVRRSVSKEVKMGQLCISQSRVKESYVIFMAGFASKGGLSGLPRY